MCPLPIKRRWLAFWQGMEARCYGFAKRYQPYLVNTVVGFIGPEYLYDSKQVTRAGLEDHFMGKLTGIPMGCDACYTNHMKADQNDIENLATLLVAAGCNYIMNPEIVGRSVETICKLAGLDTVPAGTRVLVARETGIGRGHPYSNEKLAPILAFFTGKDYKEVCERVCEVLHYEGAGHTFSIHTSDDSMVDYFATRVPASRVMVNTPSSLGGIGATTGLMPALTLGCGAVGGSSTSENVGPKHLMNLRYVGYGIKEIEQIRAEVPDCSDGICRMKREVSSEDVETIVKRIIAQLQTA